MTATAEMTATVPSAEAMSGHTSALRRRRLMISVRNTCAHANAWCSGYWYLLWVFLFVHPIKSGSGVWLRLYMPLHAWYSSNDKEQHF